MIAINRRRLSEMTDMQLREACRRLSSDWMKAGRPGLDEMPRRMLAMYIALREERSDRGVQLELF